jgi:hypothetical protein
MFWGDYHEAILKLVAAVKRHDVPLKGITVDNPYDYAMGTMPMPHVTNIDHAKIDWTARILDLERIAHENGLEFNLIINAEESGGANMAQYCKDTLAFQEMYTARGGRPDRWIVQSWYTHPLRDKVVPESKPHTFTWLVKEVIRKTKSIDEGTR